MAGKLPPVPYLSQPIDGQGYVAPVWADWFRQLVARVGGTLGQSDDWKSALTSSGYQQLPGGLTLQWGITGSVASGSTGSVIFPTPFAIGCLQAFPGIRDNSAVATANTGQCGSGNYSTTGFDIYNRTSGAKTFNWFAVGF